MSFELTLEERWADMTDAEQDAVKAVHLLLREIKVHPERYSDPVQAIEDFEFALQAVWKFERSVNYHTHWLDIKGCTCPKMDNKDMMYYGRGKIIMGDCPWHAKGDK